MSRISRDSAGTPLPQININTHPSHPIYVDNSILSKLARCDMAGWLRYGQHRTTPIEAATLRAGGDTAKALAHLRRGATAEEALALFDECYAPYSDRNVDHGDRLRWENCRVVLWQYMRFGWPEQQQRFKVIPELVEVSFELPLDETGEIFYIGRTDAAGYWDGLDIVVWDDKTTGSNSTGEYWANKWRNESGQTGYVWALRQLGYNVLGTVVNAIEYKRLPTDTKKCSTHKVSYVECSARHARYGYSGPYPRDPGFVEEWRTTAIMLARKFRQLVEEYPTVEHVRSLEKTGEFTGECAWCEFQQMCLGGRNPALLQANTVENKWDPRL